jgi:hypothetical protein
MVESAWPLGDFINATLDDEDWTPPETREEYPQAIRCLSERRYQLLFSKSKALDDHSCAELFNLCSARGVSDKWIRSRWTVTFANGFFSVGGKPRAWMLETQRLDLLTVMMLHAAKFDRNTERRITQLYNQELRYHKVRMSNTCVIFCMVALIALAVLFLSVYIRSCYWNLVSYTEDLTAVMLYKHGLVMDAVTPEPGFTLREWFTAFIMLWIKALRGLISH